MVGTFWSLIPPVIMIILVLLTKRVLLSLGVGIIVSALFVAGFQPVETIRIIWSAIAGVFVEEGGPNLWNLFILLFLFMLGIITALIRMMGGTQAFGSWMLKRVKTRVGAQLMTMILGIIVFVDDYFNSLAVGQVARPLTDRHRISRAKLAYIVDSTAAPVCVVAPISSWGAYIIGLIGSVFVTIGITGQSALVSFMEMIPMNYYVWAALGSVFVIAISKRDFGPMLAHEKKALGTGDTVDTELQGKIKQPQLKVIENGKVIDLIIPILILFLGTVLFLYMNGLENLEGEANLINIFGSADASYALFYGGLLATLVTLILFFFKMRGGFFTGKDLSQGVIAGLKSMLTAVAILVFAWVISTLIDGLGTGEYLAGVVESSNLNPLFLPLIIFVTASFIAFATGTSWGSFALLLPIAGTIAADSDLSLLLPMMAAVLAGSVFGDHCSPISDTTILSSTGSNCNHIDHVTTQLPYALVSALIAGLGYLVLGFTGNVWLGLIAVFILLAVFFVVNKNRPSSLEKEDHLAM